MDVVSRLKKAVINDDCTTLRQLLQDGINPNTHYFDNSENTALHYAAENALCNIIVILVDAGAQLESYNKAFQTPLIKAIVSKKIEAINMLLRQGANVNASTLTEMTPLKFAIQQNEEELVSNLILKGAKITHSSITTAMRFNRSNILEILLKNVNLTDFKENKFLIKSVQKNKITFVKLFIKYGCDIDTIDESNWTALYHAVHLNYLHIVSVLLEGKANPNYCAVRYKPPLYLAVCNNNIEMMNLLFSYGAKNPHSHNKKREILLEAVKTNNTEIVSKIIINEYKDVVNATDPYHRTSLMTAANKGNEQIVNLLLDMGANMNLIDNNGKDAVYFAAWNGHLHIVKIMLNKGYKMFHLVNHPDDQTLRHPNPIFVAFDRNFELELIKLLIKSASNQVLKAENDSGENLLHLSVRKKYIDILPILVKRGVQQTLNMNNETPLDIVVKNKNLNILLILLSVDKNKKLAQYLLEVINNGEYQIVEALVECGEIINENHIKAAIDKELKIDYQPSNNFIIKYEDRLKDSLLGKLFLNDKVLSEFNKHALDYAIKNKNVKVVHQICESGVVKSNSVRSESKIINDILLFYKIKLTMLPKKNLFNMSEMYPLHLGVHKNIGEFITLVEYLQIRNEDINKKCPNNETPLQKAVRLRREHAAIVLIENGADPYLSPEELIACKRNCSKELYATLIEAGAGGSTGCLPLKLRCRYVIRSNLNHFRSIRQGFNGKLLFLNYERYGNMCVNEKDQNGYNALHIAMKTGLQCVALYMIKYLNIEAKIQADDGTKAFYLAIKKNYLEIVSLLKGNTDLTMENSDLQTPLIMAAKNNNYQMVKLLLDVCEITASDCEAWTILHFAAHNGWLDVVETLLSKDIDPCLQTWDGCTPFHIACLAGNIDTVALLYRFGCNPHIRNNNLQTTLMLSTLNNNIRIVEELLTIAPDLLNLKDYLGLTSLHYAASNGYCTIANSLLNLGADYTILTNDGDSALNIACDKSHIEMISILIKHEASNRDKQSQTSLMLAVENNNIKRLEIMLQTNNVLINCIDAKSQTALHYAARKGHANIAEVLLTAGADYTMATNDKYTALDIACNNNDEMMATVLFENEINKKHCFLTSVRNNKIKIVKMLMKIDPTLIDVTDEQGFNPLHHAVNEKIFNISEALLFAGADCNAQTKSGYNSLHLACRVGCIDIIYLLFKYSLNTVTPYCASHSEEAINTFHHQVQGSKKMINQKDHDYWTSLHHAVRRGYIDIVNLLIEAGAEITIVSKTGKTVLHLASLHGHANVLKILLNHNSDMINSPTHGGWTPLHYAVFYEKIPVIIELIKAGADTTINTISNRNALHYAILRLNSEIVTILQRTNNN